ncbi:MAG TPA: metallopeptidase TldD-related protein [Candidatus Kapabacteria bacterium]
MHSSRNYFQHHLIRRNLKVTTTLLLLFIGAGTIRAQVSDKTISTVQRAMEDELTRAKSDLHLEGLVNPFFIAYTVTDQQKLSLEASNGSLTQSDDKHERKETVRLLLNNYQFNDENFSDNTGLFSFSSAPDNTLPLDDDYTGIRRVLWLSTDDLFKEANESFSKKKASMEHKIIAPELKNLPDFSKAPAVQIAEVPVELKYDRAQLEEMIKALSGEFSTRPEIQASHISLTYSNSYEWILNTEGTRVRKPVTLCEIEMQASTQADSDGEPLVLSRDFVAATPDKLPDITELHSIVDELSSQLIALKHAPRFDQDYTGPVLFENGAAADFLSENVISRLYAERADIFGNDVSAIFSSGKRSSLKEKLNTRILPVSVSLNDISLTKSKNGIEYLGYYPFDDEGVVPPADLQLVDKGILKTLYMTRTPTKEIQEPNGHARSMAEGMPGLTENAPAPGVIEYIDAKPMPLSHLKKELFDRAKEDGYDYGIVVRAIDNGAPPEDAGFSIQDMLANGKMIIPALIYKVYPDGREQLLRGAEIGLPSIRDLREIISSKESVTRNMLVSAGSGGLFSFSSKVPATLIAPEDILSPELEVQAKKPEAYPALPVVARPE